MKKKVLFVASVDKEHILKFHIPFLKYFKDNNYEVHVACAGNEEIPFCDKKFILPFARNPFKLSNFTAFKMLKEILNYNDYSIIHCHTPIGGVVGRLAARHFRSKGIKVIYTAHGFHFFKGAPLLNWIIYYPIEKLLAKYTDCLITINSEDYKLATKRKFKAKNITLVHGVGVDINKFSQIEKEKKIVLRKRNGFNSNDFIIIYPAELTKNKNQQLLIHALVKVRESVPNVKLLLPGIDHLDGYYQQIAKKYGVADNVFFLGWRNDINELVALSDVAVASSIREGLGINLIEAIACGKAIIAKNNRGHRELIKNGENGFLVSDEITMADKIIELFRFPKLLGDFENKSSSMINLYSIENVLKEMDEVYKRYMTNS
ncbi:glycosyltransferase family 4 protein [Neobacillus drentensis]|uniref:glycosyltransferase family 4 protein n=1 Tax=Neobacillus drentensis TaxID=220684 RepID=UPI003000A08F